MRFVRLLACSALVVACRDSNGGDAAPNVSVAKVNLTAPSAGSVALSTAQDTSVVCRVISATGPVHRDALLGDGGAIAGGDVMGDAFVELGAGGRLAIKNGKTTREAIIEGPGAVRGCVGGEEEIWLPTGIFGSVLGAGESPGAEVWVVTPHAIVRYGSGTRVTLTATTHLDVLLTSGNAWAYALDGITLHDAGLAHSVDGWMELPGNTVVTFTSKKAPSQVVGDCDLAAKAAHDLAVQIGTHDASLAEAAPHHVVLRQKAHALCSVAELLASRATDPVDRERLLPRAHAANAKWRDSSANP